MIEVSAFVSWVAKQDEPEADLMWWRYALYIQTGGGYPWLSK